MGLSAARGIVAAAVGVVGLLAGCGPTLQPRIYPMDQVYTDGCPSLAVAEDEYVQLTIHGSHHAEDHLLVGTCEDARLADCTWQYCGRLPETKRAPRDVCLPGKVFRKVYDRRVGRDAPGPGATFLVEPFCVKGACDLGFSLWVVSHDESIKRRGACRLQVGQVRFEDRPRGPEGRAGDFESLRFKCEVHKKGSSAPPRECYPAY
jgi:hypothetical protein